MSIQRKKNTLQKIVFALVYQVKNEYTSESDSEKPRRMADLGPRKFEGIGPTTKDGMPIVLRSVSCFEKKISQ